MLSLFVPLHLQLARRKHRNVVYNLLLALVLGDFCVDEEFFVRLLDVFNKVPACLGIVNLSIGFLRVFQQGNRSPLAAKQLVMITEVVLLFQVFSQQVP